MSYTLSAEMAAFVE